MENYAKILVALDYSDQSNRIVERAQRLAEDHSAALHLVHVVEYLPPMMIGDEPFPSSVWTVNEEQLLENARVQMQAITARLSPLVVTEHVVIGVPRHELCTIAEQEKVDLMVAGSHGRHGLARLLGSTASGLVQHVPCDLLLVRIAG
jgi:universal stress protein A